MIDHPIFENISYWGRNLKNRLVVAPMSRISASPEGLATAEMKSYYSDFAKGGFANIITEGIYTDNHYGQAYDNQPGLVNTHQLISWKDITAVVKSYGSVIIAQLMHAGALSQKFNQTVSASAIKPAGVKMTQYGGTGESQFLWKCQSTISRTLSKGLSFRPGTLILLVSMVWSYMPPTATSLISS